jgi:hydrogenase small subunit
MTQESRDEVYDLLAARGVSRRDFLTYCGAVAAMLGLGEAAAPQIASALEATLPQPRQPVLWLGLGLCTGCTESMAQISYPDVPTVVLDLLSVNYWETVQAAAGESAEKAKLDTIAAGNYIAVVEGTVMTGANGNTLRIAGKTGNEHLEEIASKATAVVAVGSCAVDGGWVRGRPNPAGGMGVAEYLKSKNIPTPVVNLPTCPVNPEWIVAVVIDALLLGKLPTLDDKGRPTLIFGSSIHDNCPRRGHFENGEFVTEFGSAEEAKGYCLYKLGCKGPQTFTNCPVVRWNRKQSWCVESGSPCIGCGNLNWTDNDGPFLDRMRSIPIGGLGNVRPEVPAYLAGGALAVGLVAHGFGMKAAGRVGDGPPMETEKVWDRKHGKGKKGGGKQ